MTKQGEDQFDHQVFFFIWENIRSTEVCLRDFFFFCLLLSQCRTWEEALGVPSYWRDVCVCVCVCVLGGKGGSSACTHTYFPFHLWISHIPSSYVMHTGCASAAGLHPPRTWTLWSLWSVWWNVCVHVLPTDVVGKPPQSNWNQATGTAAAE